LESSRRPPTANSTGSIGNLDGSRRKRRSSVSLKQRAVGQEQGSLRKPVPGLAMPFPKVKEANV
jgi:hypothetical protein